MRDVLAVGHLFFFVEIEYISKKDIMSYFINKHQPHSIHSNIVSHRKNRK